MPLPDNTGNKVPEVVFNIREDFNWIKKTSSDVFKGKRVALFALPGAFTPTCSSVHLPRYNELYQSFKDNGVDDVICLSVNDSFVLNEWKKLEKADKITMLPDGNGEFSEKMGLLVDKHELSFGKRSWRYSMIVDNGVIEKMFIEPEEEGDPYGESSAENLLKYLNPQFTMPSSVTIFTKDGCKYCAQAKEKLSQNNVIYEELVLNRDFTIKTVKALSNNTQLPQIFFDGIRIGGAEDLESYYAKSLKSKESTAGIQQMKN